MKPATPLSPRQGFLYALGAYLVWGTFPVYFHSLGGVPPTEILAHRIVGSALLLGLLVSVQGRWADYRAAFSTRRKLATYLLSTALVTGNWLLYIFAITTGHVLETSLGYFLNPLVNVLLGVLFLHETLRPRQRVAVAVAALGVLVLVVRQGSFPWMAFLLAFSFGAYGFVRKRADIDPVVGLLVETSLVTPFGLVLLVQRGLAGTGALGRDGPTTALLLGAGLMTSLPLIWFAHGVRSLRLSTMGLIQYVAPTLQFLSAVLLFHEPFTTNHAVAFGCIWAALGLYSADALLAQRTLPAAPASAAALKGPEAAGGR